jgi:puromycin-sensitive aminopeptidase
VSDNPYRLPRQVLPSHYTLILEPDLETFSFNGSVHIDISVSEPISAMTLNAAELDLKSVVLSGEGREVAITEISHDDEFERMTISLGETIQPGDYTLAVIYTGTINDQLRGFYRSTFKDPDGVEHVIATSQCQATDARRVFPCWDEPDFKATFQTTMIVADGLEAYSNTAETSRKATPDGRVEFSFAPSMKMSTYLLAFIVGEFEATEPVVVRGVPTRIIVPKGNLHLTDYALGEAAWCLEYLSDYYGIPYPGDKLDHIAIPDFSAGAMENVGLITYRDAYLVIDTAKATQGELERSLEVIAHEIAHQWFGNLVTLRWWEGAWLNEAFATFMEEKAVDARRPDWNRYLSFQLGNKAWAHGTDHLASTRTIEFEVQSPTEVDEMFDSITYGKGSAVLRQIEQFIGEEAFRQGVGDYLRTHAYGNTATSDLWAGLDGASDWSVGEIMDTWVYQRGLPQIDVEPVAGGVRISQRRFLLIPDESDSTIWKVPLMIKGSADGETFEHKLLLEDEEATLDIDGALDYVFVNAGANGFYRVRYSDDLAQRILDHIGDLEAIERFTLVNDARALMESGQISAESYLDLITGFGDEIEWAIWAEIIVGLGLIDHHALEESAAGAFREFVSSLLGPALERLGWEARDGDSDLTRKLRGSLIGAMGSIASDPTAIEKSREITRHLIAGDDVDPEIATSALGVVSRHADRDDFDVLWQAYRDASTSADETRYLRAVGRANFPEAGELIIEHIVNGDIRTQDVNLMLILMVGTKHGDDAWRAWRNRWTEVMNVIPPFTRRWAISGIANLSKPETAADVKALFAETGFPEATMYLEQRLELLDANTSLRERETPVVAHYFE